MDLYPNDSFCKETVILRITPNHILRDGFSGAGVFDCRGRLVGMVFGKSRLDPTVITVKGSAIQAILECNL
ncbi:hypothetical protein HYZ06_00050 [Candidatus Daviesbacteria bacterium]|nr:hypothetical protein [Candidatus Daviesbacteria bacterium]MBI3109421.1 hypothetical protein [Candidatus Daviesbacteria bacterium]